MSVAGPALQQLGLDVLLVHLFVFWFALLSTITPPVCGAVFIAAGMVNENWIKVAMAAMALGIGLYIIPLVMIGHPELIELANSPFTALMIFAQTAIGLTAVSHAVINTNLKWFRLLLLAVGGLVLFGIN